MNPKSTLIFGGVTIAVLVSGFFLWFVITDPSKVQSMGIIAIFLVSMMSHATMVARDVFIPLFFALTPLYNPILLGAAAGLGGALGDLIPYLLGLGISEILVQKTSKTEDLISKWVNKYGLWVIVIVAMTPLPDLPILILAGTRRLPFKKLLVIEAFGKTILYSIGAYIGGWVFELLIGTVGGFYANIILVVFSIVFSLLLTWPPSRDWLFMLLDRYLPSAS